MRPTKSRRRHGERSRITARSTGDTRPQHAAWRESRATAVIASVGLALLLAGCSRSDGESVPSAAPVATASTPPAPAPSEAGQASAAATTAAPGAAAPAPAGDPFAGIDPSQNDVLRAIARIDPAAAKGPSRPTAAPREATATATADAPRPPARPAGTAAPASAASPTGAANTVAPPFPAAPTSAPTAAPTASTVSASTTAAAPAASPALTAPTAAAAASPAPQLAAVAPAASGNGPRAPLRALAQPRPEFPREALREGYTQGRVLASLAIAADGRVTEVTVLSATPSRVFGRAAQQALREWRYEPPGTPSSVQVEMVFRNE